jgi:hypothetical protein
MIAIDYLVQVGIPIAVIMSVTAAVWALITAVQTRTAVVKIEGDIALMRSNIALLQRDQHRQYPNIEKEIEQLKSNDRSHEQSLDAIFGTLREIKSVQESQYGIIINRIDKLFEISSKP